MKNNRWLVLLFATLLLLFAGGIVKLFLMRFSSGNAYPVYSSLRSDPLGTRVFFEAVGRLENVTASRNFRHISNLNNDQNRTVCFFGLSPDSLGHAGEHEVAALERIAREGGRIVLLMYPQDSLLHTGDKKADGDSLPDQKKGSEETVKKKQAEEKEAKKKTGMVSLLKRWGFGLDLDDSQKQSRGYTAVLAETGLRLPDTLTWHSALRFSDPSGTWKILYAVDGKPVLMERTIGKGSIVVSTDTYSVSNEAMLKERHPELLVWLIGTNRFLVFDESHFGLREDPGVAALARKYHLEWFFGGLLLSAAMFIWKNSTSLKPATNDSQTGTGAALLAGKGMRAGFVNLLRRNISKADLFPLCYETWERSFRTSSRGLPERLKEARLSVTEETKRNKREKDPVSSYNRVKKILSERKST